MSWEQATGLDFNNFEQRADSSGPRWRPWGLEVPAAADSGRSLLQRSISEQTWSEPDPAHLCVDYRLEISPLAGASQQARAWGCTLRSRHSSGRETANAFSG